MTKQATGVDRDAEPVNTKAAAVPFVDLLYTESSTEALHLVNARDAYQMRNNAYINDKETANVHSMCGGITVEVPVDGELADVDGLTHLADEVDPATLQDDYNLMNHPWRVLDSDRLCASCIASWKKAFSTHDEYQTVRYNLDGSGWE